MTNVEAASDKGLSVADQNILNNFIEDYSTKDWGAG